LPTCYRFAQNRPLRLFSLALSATGSARQKTANSAIPAYYIKFLKNKKQTFTSTRIPRDSCGTRFCQLAIASRKIDRCAFLASLYLLPAALGKKLPIPPYLHFK